LKKISRNEELGFHAERKAARPQTPGEEMMPPSPRRRPIN
jgi:hypothetical protein